MSGASADATINARLITVSAAVAIAQGDVVTSVSDALVDGVRLDDVVLECNLATAAVARFTALETETMAVMEQLENRTMLFRTARDGVFLGADYNDAPNAEQRLVELQTELATQAAQKAEAETWNCWRSSGPPVPSSC